VAITTVTPAEQVFFPLDEQLGVVGTHWSEQVAKLGVWLGGLMPFGQAAEVLQKVGRIEMSESSVWRCVRDWGQRLEVIVASEQAKAMALPRRAEVVAGEVVAANKRMGVAMDGAMVHVRDEGWKELKTGCVFEMEKQPRWDQHTQEMVEMAHAVRNSYVAHLGGPEILGELVWSEAWRRGWNQACDTQVVGDAAVWVWSLADRHFYDSRQAIDWYHATQHLALAANLLKGEGTSAAHKWFKQRETSLYQGHADQIGTELLQAATQHPSVRDDLQREGNYFRNNHHRMQYLELREEGFVIGSGMVESGCKQFRGRFCGPGMRWSRPGIERLIPIRAAIMSRRFDALWQLARSLPPN
jgi:hypothetical protein